MQRYDPDELTQKQIYDLAARRVSVEVQGFKGKEWHKKVKKYAVFVISKNTSDFPGKFAVRLFDLNRPTCLVAVKNTLEEARESIPIGYKCFKRSKKDDPVIVETWM